MELFVLKLDSKVHANGHRLSITVIQPVVFSSQFHGQSHEESVSRLNVPEEVG